MRILMLTGDAGESQEIYYAKFRLEEEGWEVRIAAPAKRAFLSVVHDFEPGFDTYTEKPGYRVEADVALGDVDPAAFDGLVLPGGRAPEFLRNKPQAIAIVRHFLTTKKPVAAICHGPLLLFAAGFGKGCRMTAYPELKPEAEFAQARFEDAAAVVHDHVVTSRGWPDNGVWMGEFVKLMKSRQ